MPRRMRRELLVDVVRRLPQGTLSRGWGWLARRKRPRVGITLLKKAFVHAVGIELAESNKAIGDFETLEDLFVRTLPPERRPIASGVETVVSPVDGLVGQMGQVTEGTLFQVKGRRYSLARLLGDSRAAQAFEGGHYVTLYLAPHDYHRIHAPLTGDVTRATVLPGGLLPVFPEALTEVDELFARNERLVTYLHTQKAGELALVKVGATLVGRITTTYDASLRTNQRGQERQDRTYRQAHPILRGAELATFELGSSVLLVAEKGRMVFDKVVTGDTIKMGEAIGTISIS